jgi:hypothetical protein
MADYYQHQDRRTERGARVHPRSHGDHTGVVLTGVAILMLGLLALLWTTQENTASRLPQPAAAISQPDVAAVAPAQVPAAPVAMRAAPALPAPASYAVAAAGDTRAVKP